MQRLVITFFLASIFFIGCGAAAPSSPGRVEPGSPTPPSDNLPKPPSGDVVVRSAVFDHSNGQGSFSLHADITESRIAAVIPQITYTRADELTLTIASNAHAVFHWGKQDGPTVGLKISAILADSPPHTDTRPQITVKSGDKEKVYDLALVYYDPVMATSRGLPADAIPVYTKKDFATITENLAKKYIKDYILVNNIVLKDPHTPIAPDTSDSSGFQGTPFSGIFEGNGKTIRGLRIAIDENNLRNDSLGLFGEVKGGTVRNLRIIEPDITVQTTFSLESFSVGAVAGRFSGTIDRVAVIGGSISGNMSAAGGLVGLLSNGLIRNSYASVALDGSWGIGGLVGRATDDGRIEYSYAIGQVSAPRVGGGLVGDWDGDSITSAYFDPVLTGQDSGVGSGSATASAFYSNAADGFVYTNDRYTTKISTNDFQNWDFDTIWQIEEGRWPTLQWENP